jgi:adenine phosphoribosyltransferase
MILKDMVRNVPNWPKPGVQFKDISTLTGHAEALRQLVDELAEPFRDQGITRVAGIDARGFVLGSPVALILRAGFAMLRKEGKLPYETHTIAYDLEYGMDSLQMHTDAVEPGERVLLVDDLIATGGTALAGIGLLRLAEAEVVGVSAAIDLPDLGGSERIRQLHVPVHTLMAFEGD